jgi:ABC-2 type transport system ATP-binding protein
MTVSEIGWFTSGFYRPAFLDRYVKLADRFQLDPRARLKELSKGQYAKVGLALALAPDPEVLILDEPTSGLDLLVRREFLASMVDLAGEGRTIFLSSHQVAEVERVASHVAFIDKGKLLLAATMDELRQQIVRIELRCEAGLPDTGSLGTVLHQEGTGNQWQVIVQHPNREAIAALQAAAGVSEVEETPVGLEETYCALLARKETSLGQRTPEEVQP